MSQKLNRHEAVHATLRRLVQYCTLSPFSRVYYCQIYDWLGAPGLLGGKLDQAFHLLLRSECRRHQAVAHIVNQGNLDVLAVVRVGRAVHDVFLRLCHALGALELEGRDERMICRLLVAQCRYHLGHTEHAIRALRGALELGCDHALVYFATGYNLYYSALQQFSHTDTKGVRIAAKDKAGFARVCAEAVEMFEAGLGDPRFDGQIYWWIGTISEARGDLKSARKAFIQAMKSDPAALRSRVEKKLRNLRHVSMITRSPAERKRLSQLSPITDEEIEEAREILAESDAFPPKNFLNTEDS